MCESWSCARLRRCVAGLGVVIALGLASAAARADDAQPEAAESSRWFFGAYYRHAWVPKPFLKPFLERADSISNDGLGLVVSRVAASGLRAQLGVGYMPYRFQGAFNARGGLVEDTEFVTSTLALLHLTGSVLWPVELHRMLRLEIGLGLDLGVVLGSLRRSEAYSDADGKFRRCDSALHPGVTGPDNDGMGGKIPYCAQPVDSAGKAIATNTVSTQGEQYGVRESRVPPVMLLPLLPHVALRFSPVPRVSIALEAAFAVAQFWVGASVHVALFAERSTLVPVAQPEQAAVAPAAPVAAGPRTRRLIGKLFEEATKAPIARASVKTKRAFSAIQTDGTGLFVFDQLQTGPLLLAITHPDYEASSCTATIPPEGGDTFVQCFLRPLPKEGAISGQVKDEQGKPIARARVTVAGPLAQPATFESNADGLFAVPDAPEGTYRVGVEAAGYLRQVIELEVRARETAMPQIILLKATDKP
ncbi:MAG: hypothetical protein RL701_922 [Pseudomonadota bacterium]